MIKAISNDYTELMLFMTQKDCTTLKKLIVENPEAPLLIFVGEEANSGEYQYESTDSGSAFLEEITKQCRKAPIFRYGDIRHFCLH